MVQIYRVLEKENSSSFLHNEVCRSCASAFQNKGLSIEIDGHLQKYVNENNGRTYYENGTNEKNPEIECSICGVYLISEDEFLTEGVLNALARLQINTVKDMKSKSEEKETLKYLNEIRTV